ncbi:BTAD domain-containing putative transcriptional regulator [Oscillospiraceae bacterium MB08-C2-2]|nr:BTAD domain-containing putative transcriptional regulator [Oscillospiraceae bacterium MB08-C2-2]
MAGYASPKRQEVIRVRMLGEFSVMVGETVIKDTASRTRRLWNLVEYLVAYRRTTLSIDEIIGALWPENDIENPANALKNLVYRIRSTFASRGVLFAKEMIVFNRGSYRWNNELPCQVDTELFETACKQAEQAGLGPQQQLALCLEAISLYKGNFLPESSFESWVVPLASYYRSMYFKCVYKALELLTSTGEFGQVELICKKALLVDQFEEPVHQYLIVSLIRQGQQAQAMEHYNTATELFYRELGVTPSEAMRQLYKDIAAQVQLPRIDLTTIKQELRESEGASGAYYCEYEIFKRICRIEARSAARSGQAAFLTLITLDTLQEAYPDSSQQGRAMAELYEVLQEGLRKGDVFSRVSVSQYLALLPTVSERNCRLVTTRISERFKRKGWEEELQLRMQIQPLEPVGTA